MNKNVPKNGQNIAISVKFHETVKLIVPGCVISFKTSQFTLIGGIVKLKELRFRNPHTHLISIQIEISV